MADEMFDVVEARASTVDEAAGALVSADDRSAHEPWWRLPRSWWLWIGNEDPIACERCQAVPPCVPSPVDVYCPEHGELLPFQDLTGRRRTVIFNIARVVFVTLVVLAAQFDTPWPVYALATVVGAVCIGVLLRAHRVARLVGVVGWVVAASATAGVAAAELDADGMRAVRTVAGGLVLALALALSVHAAILPEVDDDGAAEGGARYHAWRAIASSTLTAAVVVAAGWLLSGRFSSSFVEVPDWVSRWLLFSGLGMALGGLLVAAICGFILSWGNLSTAVRKWSAFQFRRVHWRYEPKLRKPTSRELGHQLACRLHNFYERLKRSAKALARQVVNGTTAAANLFVRMIYALVNWLRKRLIMLGRRTKFVLHEVCRAVVDGLRNGVVGLDHAWRPALALIGAVGGAVAGLHVADGFTDYLVDGPIAGLAAGAGWSLLGVAVCFAVAERLASVRTREMVEAAGAIVNNAAPDILLFTVFAGWVVGIPGSLGYGPIRVGWVTGVGTLVLMAIVLPSWWRERRAEPTPAAA